MPQIKSGLPMVMIWFSVLGGGVLQFSALFFRADEKAFTVLSYSVYAVCAVIFALSVVYAFTCKKTCPAICIQQTGRRLMVCCAALSLGLLYDFIHQCYNLYSYFENVGYIEYNYVVPIALSGLFALASSGYYIAFLLTLQRTGVDYKSFTAFHFAPLLWAFFKIFNLVTGIFDVSTDEEDIIHFILLVALMSFFVCFALASDKKERPMSKGFVVSTVFSAAMCFIISVPRLLMILIGNVNSLKSVNFSAPTYFLMAFFIISLYRVNRRAEMNA